MTRRRGDAEKAAAGILVRGLADGAPCEVPVTERRTSFMMAPAGPAFIVVAPDVGLAAHKALYYGAHASYGR